MKEHPILMRTEMVRAYLEGRKAQTRRVIKIPQYGRIKPATHYDPPCDSHNGGVAICFDQSGLADWKTLACPYGQVGDRLWVKETLEHSDRGIPTRYAADGCPVMRDGESIDWPFRKSPLPSIFMPRWASRITLEITGIRVGRAQDITEQDAIAEGMTGRLYQEATDSLLTCARDVFQWYWDSINAKRGYSWQSNPWVWVIEWPKYRPNSP